MNIKRGEINLTVLDPVVGREISKTRPVVVVSNDKNNEFSATVTILPLTSRNLQKIYPFELFLPKGAGNLPKDSKVKADQIRTLDKSRLLTLIGKLEREEIIQIEKAVKIHLELSWFSTKIQPSPFIDHWILLFLNTRLWQLSRVVSRGHHSEREVKIQSHNSKCQKSSFPSDKLLISYRHLPIPFAILTMEVNNAIHNSSNLWKRSF